MFGSSLLSIISSPVTCIEPLLVSRSTTQNSDRKKPAYDLTNSSVERTNSSVRVEQSVPEYNVRSTVFLEHRANWDSDRSAVRSLTWSTIIKSADPLDAFDRAIGEVISTLLPTTVLRSRSGHKQWFDASYRRAYDAKQTAYRTWCRARRADRWAWFVFAHAEDPWEGLWCRKGVT